MGRKIILSSDSTADLSKEIIERYNVMVIPLHIVLNGEVYDDNINITPEEIFENFEKNGTLPKTTAVNSHEYSEAFKPYIEQGYDIVHISIGSALSMSYEQCCITARELGHIYPIDSCNSSAGSAMLLIEAAKRIEQGMSAEHVAKEVRELTAKCHNSYVLGTLTYMTAGGRCPSLSTIGINALGIRPRIDISGVTGRATIGKKYRGRPIRMFENFVNDQLKNIDSIESNCIFIIHSGVEQEIIDHIYEIIESKDYFDKIYITKAGCTISSHRGSGSLGMVYMKK